MRYLIVCLMSCLAAPVAAATPPDLAAQLDLAARMLQDGHPSRALGILLSQTLPAGNQDKAVRLRQRYHTLAGLAYLKLQQYPKALEHLEQARAENQPDPHLYVYLAQGYHRLQRHADTLAAIDQAAAVMDQYPALYELKAQSHWQLHQEEAAWRTLTEARRKFPKEMGFLRRQVFYLLEKQLYHQAAELGLAYLDLSHSSAQDYAALGNALRLGGEMELAGRVLEQGRLRYPQDITLAKLLAHTYLSREMPMAAAWIMEQAARLDPSLQADAVELYRRAGAYYRALYLNAAVPDVKTQRRQHLALLLALQRYDEMLALHRPLARVGLLEEDTVRYALAYAAYRTGRFQLVEPYLSAIRDPKVFRQAAELRRLLKECEGQPWRCT